MRGALCLLCGDDARMQFLDFNEGDSFEELTARIEELVIGNRDVSTIVCTDVWGGSPFKAAVLVRMKHSEVRVVTGTNFPLLMELLFPSKEFDDADAMVEHAVTSAREALACVEL